MISVGLLIPGLRGVATEVCSEFITDCLLIVVLRRVASYRVASFGLLKVLVLLELPGSALSIDPSRVRGDGDSGIWPPNELNLLFNLRLAVFGEAPSPKFKPAALKLCLLSTDSLRLRGSII